MKRLFLLICLLSAATAVAAAPPRYREACDGVRARAAALESQLSGLNVSTSVDKTWRQRVRDSLEAVRSGLTRVETSFSPESYRETKRFMEELDHADKIVAGIRSKSFLDPDVAVFSFPPMSGEMVLPDTLPTPGRIANRLLIVAAPGEYEPAGFILRPYRETNDIRLRITDLKCGRLVIPASAADARIVKCWYQSRGAWDGSLTGTANLVPELLLHDDTLVTANPATKKNFLKLTFPDRTEYVDISDPDKKYWRGTPDDNEFTFTTDKFPVRDAGEIQPFDAPAGANKQILVTVHVPDQAQPGLYRGEIQLTTGAGKTMALGLDVRVLPFVPARPKILSSVFYQNWIGRPDGPGVIGRHALNESQYRTQMKNLVAHGVLNPAFVPGHKRDDFYRYVRIMKECGVDTVSLFPLQLPGIALEFGSGPMPLEKVREIVAGAQRNHSSIVRDLRELSGRARADFGTRDIFAYAFDEAHGEQVTLAGEICRILHEGGLKAMLAGYPGTFELVGDKTDVFIWGGPPAADEAAKWHALGRRIFDYGNPQAGLESPAVYRRNFGVLLWKYGYDGAMTWAYDGSYSFWWNDFDSPTSRDCVFVYPTVDGVIDTLAWEGYREASDDVRYITTLEELIAENLPSTDRQLAGTARQARRYLDSIDPLTRDLDAMRLEIIDYCLRLGKKEPVLPVAAPAGDAVSPRDISSDSLRPGSFGARMAEENRRELARISQGFPCYTLKAPVLDGSLDDPVWRQAPPVPDIPAPPSINNSFAYAMWRENAGEYKRRTGKEAPPSSLFTEPQYIVGHETCIRMLTDGADLYFGLLCRQPGIGVRTPAHARDMEPLWTDNSLELFLMPEGAAGFAQFIVNTAGARYNALRTEKKIPADAMLAGWEAKTCRQADCWSAEIRVSGRFLKEAFGSVPSQTNPFRLNIIRNIFPSRPARITGSSTDGEYSRLLASWAPITEGAREPDKFLRVFFPGPPPADAP